MRLDTIRLAARHLARNPGYATLSIAAIALGVGATTAVFSLFSAVLLRPLPYPDADRIYAPYLTSSSAFLGAGKPQMFSYPKFETFRAEQSAFGQLAVWADDAINLAGEGTPERLSFEYVSPAYFSILGVAPERGRLFAEATEGAPGGPLVVLLSHDLWQRRFGGDEEIVGRSIALERHTGTVIGVLPAGFSGLSDGAEIWLPVSAAPSVVGWSGVLTNAGSHWLHAVARLRSDVDPRSVAATVEAAGRAVAAAHPAPAGHDDGSVWGAGAQTLAASRSDPALRRALVILLAAVVGVLFVACANLAGLGLARSTRRAREIALHSALGAGRASILRRLLVETSLLATVGGALGVALARMLTEGLVVAAPTALGGWGISGSDLIGLRAAALDQRVLLFALGVTAASALLSGLGPAISATRSNPAAALRLGTTGTLAGLGGQGSHRARRLLVVGQTAVAVVLLFAAGLMLRSLASLLRVDPGFRPEQVVSLHVIPSQGDYTESSARAMHAELLQRIRGLPGVAAASSANCLPVSSNCNGTIVTSVDGIQKPRAEAPWIGVHQVGVGHFRTLSIPVLSGREFDDRDREGGAAVILVNRAAARELWPGQDPVGRRLGIGMLGPDGADGVVIGVVGDVQYGPLEADPAPQVYLADLQSGWPSTYLLVRTAGDPVAVLPALRGVIRDVAPTTPVLAARTLDEQISRATSRLRFAALLLAAFAATALALAALGVYGVLAQMVADRRRELGVRMALGADGGRVERLVLRHGFGLALAGAVLGLPFAWAAAHTIESLLFETPARDPWMFFAVPLFVLAAAALACWLPARRAAALDPATILRAD